MRFDHFIYGGRDLEPIGVGARDLRDFAVSLRRASEVMPGALPQITVALREGLEQTIAYFRAKSA